MEPLSIIRDRDIFENPITEPKFYTIRQTVKGIVLDGDGNIALLSTHGHSLFPGGGVEDEETKEMAFIRECKEELGCDVIIIGYIGEFFQYRSQTAKKYEISFFVAHVIGDKGIPTTKNQEELDCVISWETLEETIGILQNQIVNASLGDYSVQFNAHTHLLALQYFLEMKK